MFGRMEDGGWRMEDGTPTPLAPVLRGEGPGVRGERQYTTLNRFFCRQPLTPTLSPEYRGEGET